MKKYRIRKLSFAWWFTRLLGAFLALFGGYCWIVLALGFAGLSI